MFCGHFVHWLQANIMNRVPKSFINQPCYALSFLSCIFIYLLHERIGVGECTSFVRTRRSRLFKDQHFLKMLQGQKCLFQLI
ncbi:hypothetical protein VNO78_18700 [Psophocarpus tetragonolobus]|uniref:Uncharacterized protein n=1 Tax=Psophocarpus tetragonolobus TaxID=3891 RepID=A0AAN9S7E0_PSOTE